MARPIDYSKWDNFVDDDEENDTGPTEQQANQSTERIADAFEVNQVTTFLDDRIDRIDPTDGQLLLAVSPNDKLIVQRNPDLAKVDWLQLTPLMAKYQRLQTLGYSSGLSSDGLSQRIIDNCPQDLLDGINHPLTPGSRPNVFQKWSPDVRVRVDWMTGRVKWAYVQKMGGRPIKPELMADVRRRHAARPQDCDPLCRCKESIDAINAE